MSDFGANPLCDTTFHIFLHCGKMRSESCTLNYGLAGKYKLNQIYMYDIVLNITSLSQLVTMK